MRSIYDKCAGRVSHYRDGQIKSLYRLPLTFIMHYTPPIRINNWPGPGEQRTASRAHGRSASCSCRAHEGLTQPSSSSPSISPRLLALDSEFSYCSTRRLPSPVSRLLPSLSHRPGQPAGDLPFLVKNIQTIKSSLNITMYQR